MATKVFSDVSGKEVDCEGIHLFDEELSVKNDYDGVLIDLTSTEKKEFKKIVQDFVKNKKLSW